MELQDKYFGSIIYFENNSMKFKWPKNGADTFPPMKLTDNNYLNEAIHKLRFAKHLYYLLTNTPYIDEIEYWIFDPILCYVLPIFWFLASSIEHIMRAIYEEQKSSFSLDFCKLVENNKGDVPFEGFLKEIDQLPQGPKDYINKLIKTKKDKTNQIFRFRNISIHDYFDSYHLEIREGKTEVKLKKNNKFILENAVKDVKDAIDLVDKAINEIIPIL